MKKSRDQKWLVWIGLSILALSWLNADLYAEQQNYRFERMWGSIQPSWYFHAPLGIAVDQSSYVYVADAANDRIRKFTSDGHPVTEWGTNGDLPGEFNRPDGIAVDKDGFVYVADSYNDRIQKFTSDGIFLMEWGQFGEEPGQFNYPIGITVDIHGYVYVTDAFNDRIQKFTSSGDVVTQWGSYGDQQAQFDYPIGIAVDDDGSVYVCDSGNLRIQKFTDQGQFQSQWIQPWTEQGFPSGIVVAPDGTLVVTDTDNDRIMKFNSAGTVLMTWSQEGAADEQLDGPEGIAVDPQGFVYVADSLNDRIEKFTDQGLFITVWGTSDGDGKFHRPRGIDILIEDSLPQFVYVTDYERHHIQKFTPWGRFVKMWGNDWMQGSDGSGDGELNHPTDVAVSVDELIYVTDTGNHRVQVFDTDGQFIRKWGTAGTGQSEFSQCLGIAVDQFSNVYVVDSQNHRIQKFNTDGQYITQWGSSGSEPGQLDFPQGIDVDDGYVYVTDTGNHRVQKFTDDGEFVDQWGNFGAGDGCFSSAAGITADRKGFIFVSDSTNCTIQKFTVTGEFIERYGELGTGPGLFDEPDGICVDPDGKVLVADGANHRVQIIQLISYTSGLTKAVIVAGGGAFPGNAIWDATQMNTNFAYRTLMYQGLTKNHICYLSSALDQDLDNNGEMDDIDDEATNENLQYAITEWAADADSVVVYLADHGGTENFRLSNTEMLDAYDLDNWLDELQNKISDEVVVVYDACKSGSFLPILIPEQGKKRIVIASALPNQGAYFVSSGSISFSYFFWTNVFNGNTIGEAYDLACDGIANLLNQTPLLDDNGNGVGNEDTDMSYANSIKIGNGTISYDEAPVIDRIAIDPENITDTSAEISAQGVTDLDGISRVWAVIRPPDYHQAGHSIPVLELPSVDLLPQGNDNYAVTYDEFSISGDYYIAVYARDRMGNTSAPNITTVSVKTLLHRKVVIIAGGWLSDPLWNATEKNARLAYRALKFQGYSDDNIYYISPAALDGVDDMATLDNCQYALNTWAAQNTQDLIVYLIGQGQPDVFCINKTDAFTVETFDNWLDNINNAIPGKVTVVCDFHYSGSFLTGLPCPLNKQRIVMCSAQKNQPAHYLNAGDLSFSKFFWTQILNGNNVRNAFTLAVDAISFAGLGQNPGLDDNGNGIENERNDGFIARNYKIGIGIMLAGDDPLIQSVNDDQALNGQTSLMLFAENVTTTDTIDQVWAVIAPPARQITTPTDIEQLPGVEMVLNEQNNRYEYLYSGFDRFGTHRVTIYARDTLGNTSLPVEVTVVQTLGPDMYEQDNTYLQANSIVVNSAESEMDIPGQWHNFDTHGDEDWAVFYAEQGEPYVIETADLGQNADTVIEIYDTDGSTLLGSRWNLGGDSGEPVSMSWSCPDDGAYYIRVTQFDPAVYGADTEYELKVTMPQGALFPGFLCGIIRDGSTRQCVQYANVLGSPTGAAVTGTDGAYMLALPEGTYSLTAQSQDHTSHTIEDITVAPGQISYVLDIYLQPAVEPVGVVTIGQGGAKALTFTDSDGTSVNLKLSGPGAAQIRCLGDDIIADDSSKGVILSGSNIRINGITLTGTTEKSALTIKIKGGDGHAQVDCIVSGTPLKQLSAKGVDLTGEGIIFTGQGYIASMQINDLLNGAGILMAGTGCEKGITIKVNNIDAGADIILAPGVKSFSAVDWQSSELMAPWANTITVLNDCAANLTMTDQDAKGYSISKLTVGAAASNMNLSLKGGAKAINLGNWNEGSLFAPFIGAINIKGNMGSAVSPDCAGVNIHLTGADSKGFGLGSFKAAGCISDSQFIIAQNVKSFSANQWAPASVIAVGVYPGQGGYFDGDETSMQNGASVKSLSIGSILDGNNQTRFGIHVNDYGKIMIDRRSFKTEDLSYQEDDFYLNKIQN